MAKQLQRTCAVFVALAMYSLSAAADRLLLNMLRYAGSDAAQSPVKVPDGFDAQLKALGYHK